jgi:hypothetical protein
VFRHVSARAEVSLIEVGGAHPLDMTQCARIAGGQFPAFAHDVGMLRDSYGLSAFFEALGGHVGVPVRYADGTPYGMLCGFSLKPCPHLSQRDVKRLELSAQAIGRLRAQAAGHDVNTP